MPIAKQLTRSAISLSVLILLSACTGMSPFAGGSTVFDELDRNDGPRGNSRSKFSTISQLNNTRRDNLVDRGAVGSDMASLNEIDPELGALTVSLSFVDTDVREFARILFSELLSKPYVIDESASGRVTLRSGGKVDGNAALAMARQALAISGNSIVKSEGIFRVARSQEQSGLSGDMINVTLRHISANSAQEAITPLLKGRAEIISARESSLSLRGDPETLSLVNSLLQLIDVDQFKSASFGLFPLQNSGAEDVSSELEKLYAGAGVSGVTLLPILRLNSVLIIAKRVSHLDFAEKWLKRLDSTPRNESQVNVYNVHHRKAADLAVLLKDIFSQNGVPNSVDIQALSDDSESVPIQSGQNGSSGHLRITADPLTNTLVVRAKPEEHSVVERALYRLDLPLQQVYVEATIAEVRLSNELSHGVKWFVESGGFSAGITNNQAGMVGLENPGFNFSFNVPKAQVVISALEAYTDVKVISSPTLTVMDRESAIIQVGDQIPVITKTVQNSSSGENVIANSVEFRDTGIILKVTPSVRDSGNVVLEIEQEVSGVVPTTSSNINSPTISQRKISSTVSVPDGTAIVLAGLINNNSDTSSGGLPGTQRTLLESIFGSKKSTWARSELLLIVRVVVIQDKSDLREIVREVASKMRLVTQATMN